MLLKKAKRRKTAKKNQKEEQWGNTFIGTQKQDEFTIFELAAPVARFGNTLATFFKTLEEFNPLTFWKADKQELHPLHFLANTVTLTFGSTSIIQESVFSSCGDTLTQR